MNIPSVPTDNLYKFWAIFGLILIVFSSYMLEQSNSVIFTKLDKLEAKESINKLKAEQDSTSVSVKIDKINFNTEYKGVSRQADRFIKLYTLYLIFLILGFGLSAIGFYCWFHRTQKLNDKILEIETEKVKNDNQKVVHRLQFEKEFKVYKELWPLLMQLRNSTSDIRPVSEIYKESDSKEDIRNSKKRNFSNNYKACLEIFDHNKPFYPEVVYSKIEKVLLTSKKEIYALTPRSELKDDYYEEGEKNMELIREYIDEICVLIRDRIGMLRIEK